MKTRKFMFAIALLVLMTSIAFAKDMDNATDNHQRIAKRFVSILHEQWGVDPAKVFAESCFKKDFGADTLDIVELVMALEEAFDIEIPDEQWGRVTTVDSAVELIADQTDRRY